MVYLGLAVLHGYGAACSAEMNDSVGLFFGQGLDEKIIAAQRNVEML
jgi:hypothetical protein